MFSRVATAALMVSAGLVASGCTIFGSSTANTAESSSSQLGPEETGSLGVNAYLWRATLDTLATAADGFSGAEIEQAVVSALYSAHADGVPVDEARVVTEVGATRPLSVLMAEQVNALRAWASGRTVPAD